jgi:hypothetical protein
MKIHLHLALEVCGADAFQSFFEDRREKLAREKILYPETPGRRNHLRLYLSALDDDHVDSYRHLRDLSSKHLLENLRGLQIAGLEKEIAEHQPDHLVLSAYQLVTGLTRVSELERLKDILNRFSDDITLIMHVEEHARVATRNYINQLILGRNSSLDEELTLTKSDNWMQSALDGWQGNDPAGIGFEELQSAPFWLDYENTIARWEGVFGDGTVQLRSFTPDMLVAEKIQAEIQELLPIPSNIGKFKATDEDLQSLPFAQMETQTTANVRALNTATVALIAQDLTLPPKLQFKLRRKAKEPSDMLAPGSLSAVSEYFADSRARLMG